MTKCLNLYLAIFSAQFLWECHRRHMRSDLWREEWASALQCMARQWHLKNKYNSPPWWFTMPFTVTEQEDKGEKKTCIQCYNELCFLIFVEMEWSCLLKRSQTWSCAIVLQASVGLSGFLWQWLLFWSFSVQSKLGQRQPLAKTGCWWGKGDRSKDGLWKRSRDNLMIKCGVAFIDRKSNNLVYVKWRSRERYKGKCLQPVKHSEVSVMVCS